MSVTGHVAQTVWSKSPSAVAAASQSSVVQMLIRPFCSHVPSPSPRMVYFIGADGGGDVGGGGLGDGGGGLGDGGGGDGGGARGGGEQATTSQPTQSGSVSLEVPKRQRM